MKIHIIIPVHNHCENSLECLRLLSVQTWKDFDITLTDDGSTDGTYEVIRERFPDVVVLRGDGNLWWTGSINIALNHVLDHAQGTDYVLTLNNDTKFHADYLQKLADAAIQRPDALIGSVAIDEHDHRKVIDPGVYFDWRTCKQTAGEFRQGCFFSDQVNRLSGRGTLIPVRVFRTVGLYDGRRLPHYGADYELSIRASRHGFPLCVYYGAVLYSDATVSGLKSLPHRRISLSEALELLCSNKSVWNVKKRFYFRLLCCPGRYLPRNLLTVVKGILIVLMHVAPLWYMFTMVRQVVRVSSQGDRDQPDSKSMGQE